MRTTDRIAISSVSHRRHVSGRTFRRTLAIRSARRHIGYGHPHDSETQNCAGWARGPQNRWQLHRISGSKSRSASDGSNSVVTAPKAKVKVESFAVGAREKFSLCPHLRFGMAGIVVCDTGVWPRPAQH